MTALIIQSIDTKPLASKNFCSLFNCWKKNKFFFTIDADPFDLFHYGLNISKENSFLDNYEDKLRLDSEECDNIQVEL